MEQSGIHFIISGHIDSLAEISFNRRHSVIHKTAQMIFIPQNRFLTGKINRASVILVGKIRDSLVLLNGILF